MSIFSRFKKSKEVVRKLFLIAKGRSNENLNSDFERYTGVGLVQVVAVNPTKEELSEIYGRTIDNDQVYVYPATSAEESDMARVSFIVKTTDDDFNEGVDYTGPLTFIIRDSFLTSDKSGVEKVKVIDNYGQTSWASEEDLKNQVPPIQSNGNRAKIIPPYRPMYSGEEELVDFLKKYLGIDNPMRYANGVWEVNDNFEDCAISLENIKNYFKGDVSEIKEAVMAWNENKIKALFYVRTNDENKSYQQILPNLTLRPGAKNYEPFLKKVLERKEQGAFEGCTFTYGPLQPFQLVPTQFEKEHQEKKSSWFKD